MMPSAGRDGWRGAFFVGWWCFVVCGNEKGPVSSMVVDGTGLDGVWIGFIVVVFPAVFVFVSV